MNFNWENLIYLLAIVGLVMYFRRPKTKNEPSKANGVSWSPIEALAITIAIYYSAQFIGGVLALIGPAIAGWSTNRSLDWLQNNVFGQFTLIVIVEALTVGMLFWYLKRRKTNLKAIGLVTPKWRDIGYVLAGFLAYFVAYILLASVAQKFIPDLNFNQKQQLGFETAHGGQLALVFASLVLLPPLAEELLMRGFLYSGLRKGLKIWQATLITSVLFGLAHLQAGSGATLLWTAALDTFVLSLVLVYLRQKTGSLWSPIGLHMLKNGIAFMALFVFHLV